MSWSCFFCLCGVISYTVFFFFFFFFQAEDGIRDVAVTGVQTCALPILLEPYENLYVDLPQENVGDIMQSLAARKADIIHMEHLPHSVMLQAIIPTRGRSEERRVGKECRSRGSPEHYNKIALD